jgi:transglutaminase-like putative cysteine protease
MPASVNPGELTLEVRHQTIYRYTSPVSLAQHQAHLAPLEDLHQQRLAFALQIEPKPAFRRDSQDALGNPQTHFSLAAPHLQLAVTAESRVRVRSRFEGLRPEASPAWETLAAGLRYVAGGRFEPAVEFAAPSPYVPRLPQLHAYALPSFPPGAPVAEAALNLMQRLHADFAYESASTQVDTPLAQVLVQRRGVCQDFAHLLIGALRTLGLPARYVSGYLLTHTPGDVHAPIQAPMLGADASHAWVQLWCPGTPGVPTEGSGAGWLSLDPTNNLVPTAGHVRLAIGRDYGDVTPLRGVIRGGGRHELTVAVQTRIVENDTEAVARPLHGT